MGNIINICTSCYSGNTNAVTVKLILLDGQLREYSSPVKVFVVAQPETGLTNLFGSLICNSDVMDYDKYVTAMSEDEELQLGQLYFELPVSWLNRRLTAEDMASLAVKAGKALMVGGGKVSCGCWVKRVDPLVFCEDDETMSSSGSRGGCGDTGNHGVGGGGHRGCGGKGRMFTRLERIVEE